MTTLDIDAPATDAARTLDSIPRAQSVIYERGHEIFTQGEPSNTVIRVVHGLIRLSVVSPSQKEAVVDILHAGDYFGEACLAGERRRQRTATAITRCTVTLIEKRDMEMALRSDFAFADRFLRDMLRRNVRMQNHLVDQLLNTSEKRVARALVLLARHSAAEAPPNPMPMVSQTTLAAMVGTTRSRVNFFVNKFRKLGFIELDNGLKINSDLLTFVLRE